MARRASEVADPQFTGHPLFPVEEGEPEPIVAFINVTRFENGGQAYADRVFKADELTDLGQVLEQYGGGKYELIGRCPSVRDGSKPGNYSCRRRVQLPGKSLPLSDRSTDTADVPQVQVTAPASGGLGGMGENLIIAFLQMNQQNQERAQQASAAQALQAQQQQQQFMTMLMQFVSAGKSDAAAMTQLMMQMSAQQQQSTMAMMTTVLSQRGGGPEEMAKYADLIKTLGGLGGHAEKEEDDGMNIPKMIEDVADAVTGFVQLQGGMGAMGSSNGAPAAPGSAASVIAGGKR